MDRITQSPDVMGGRPCVRGMRVTVGMIVGQIGAGRSVEAILADYPYLDREDVLQALRYAAFHNDAGNCLNQMAPDLEAGALLSVEPARFRLRLLPLKRR